MVIKYLGTFHCRNKDLDAVKRRVVDTQPRDTELRILLALDSEELRLDFDCLDSFVDFRSSPAKSNSTVSLLLRNEFFEPCRLPPNASPNEDPREAPRKRPASFEPLRPSFELLPM